MFFEFSEDQKVIKKLARDFAEKRPSIVAKGDEEEICSEGKSLPKWRKFGLLGRVLPEEFGSSSVGFLSTMLITEELARESACYSMVLKQGDYAFLWYEPVCNERGGPKCQHECYLKR